MKVEQLIDDEMYELKDKLYTDFTTIKTHCRR